MDHTTIREGGPLSQAGNIPLRWWLKEGEDAAQGVSATLASMRGRQSARILQHIVSARLYGNMSALGLANLALRAQPTPLLRDRISYNAVASAIDTITSKIAKNKPKPLFLTSGGDYKLQRRARKLNQFIEGVFYENEAYKIGVAAFRDGAVFGDGVIHVYAENGRVRFERVSAIELWVDEQEAWYGEPRQMHRTKRVDRAVMLDMVRAWGEKLGWDKAELGKKLDKIEGATPIAPEQPYAANVVSDLVEVRESWHLPDGPEATKDDPKGGAHSISIDGCELFREPYLKDFFPFARFRWCPRLFGYWSQGGAEQVQNLQLEINKLLWVIQRSFHLAGSYKVLVENGSKVINEHLSNDIGAIVRYTGTPPQYVTPQIVPVEIFNHLLTLKAAVYEQLGVSQLSANSQKPAGLNSGKALREFNDIESDRFQVVGQEYERFFVDIAKIAISVVKDIAGNRGAYKVRAPTRRAIVEIDWKDVHLEDDSYVLQAFPVSSLPNEPAGRQQTIQEWVQAGWISPRQGRRLMDFPDLEMAEGLANAAEDWITEVLERMTDDGEYTPPEPFDDLKLGYELALEYYARGKVQGLEEERLEMLRRYMEQVHHLEQMAQPPPQPQQGQVPQAVPQQPPQSDLQPFAGAA